MVRGQALQAVDGVSFGNWLRDPVTVALLTDVEAQVEELGEFCVASAASHQDEAFMLANQRAGMLILVSWLRNYTWTKKDVGEVPRWLRVDR